MTHMAASLEPRRHTIELPCHPEHAFADFTYGLGDWWDPAYSPDPDTFTSIVVEPVVGGGVVLVHGDMAYPFGEVTVWEPGARLSQSFWLAMDRAHPSALDVRFAATGDGCRVRFEHGGWTADNAASRDKFGGWPGLLARYASAAG